MATLALGSALLAWSAPPLTFEPNRGQADPSVRYLSRGRDVTILLKDDRVAMALPDHSVELRFGGASTPVAIAPTGGHSNYLRGSDPAQWRTAIPHFGKVRYPEVFPGVDLLFYGAGSTLEFDFELRPGADPEAIRLQVDGASKMRLERDGSLRLTAGKAEFRFPRPEIYQPLESGRVAVEGAYRLVKGGIRFQLGPYDRALPLVIDPVLHTTYWGGIGNDMIFGAASDASGATYFTGYTNSFTFTSTTGAYKSVLAMGDADAFVTKLNAAGTAVVYSTFVGGPSADMGRAIAVDSSGAAYLTGSTLGRFPVTTGAFRTTITDAPQIFVAKISPAGSALVYATYLGGAGAGQGIAVDASGAAVIAGFTYTPTFPLLSPAQAIYWGGMEGFVTKLNPAGSAQVYSTFLGGTGDDEATAVALDPSGAAYVTGYTAGQGFQTTTGAYRTTLAGGSDAFAVKLSPAGVAVYSTYLGGAGIDRGNAIAVDSTGSAYIAGQTTSTNFPVTSGVLQTTFGGGAADGFVAKLTANGGALTYSTYLGGSGTCQFDDSIRSHSCDSVFAIAVDSSGSAYLGGLAGQGFPLTAAHQSVAGGAGDGFAAQLDAAGARLLYSSFIGGTGQDAVSALTLAAGVPVAAGQTTSLNLPVSSTALRTTNAGGANEGFISRLNACAVTLGSSGSYFPASSGSYSLAVFAPATCSWSASSNASWVTLNSTSGVGNGQVSYTVAANTSPARVGQITVSGQTYTLQQVNGACVQLGYTGSWFPQSGGSYTLPVFATCAWQAVSNVPWVTITSGASGTGNGTIAYTVAANPGGQARFGQVDIGGHIFSVSQVGGPAGLSCQYQSSKLLDEFDRTGGSSSLLITTAEGCEWTVTTTQPWIQITGGLAGSGVGVTGYTVAPNGAGVTRSGQILVGGLSIGIRQDP